MQRRSAGTWVPAPRWRSSSAGFPSGSQCARRRRSILETSWRPRCATWGASSVTNPILDGERHRVPIEGDRRGEKSGFYVAHWDGRPAGYAKNHRTGAEIRWKAKGYVLDPTERAKLRA